MSLRNDRLVKSFEYWQIEELEDFLNTYNQHKIHSIVPINGRLIVVLEKERYI